jgi:hypothetical protein
MKFARAVSPNATAAQFAEPFGSGKRLSQTTIYELMKKTISTKRFN